VCGGKEEYKTTAILKSPRGSIMTSTKEEFEEISTTESDQCVKTRGRENKREDGSD